MPLLSADVMLVRRTRVVANDLSATETVMLDIDRGTYFGVRGVARRIWDRLATPSTLDMLVDDLTSIYDVDAETCRVEAAAFLNELLDHGLIDVADD
jgi:hypothetical protein